MTTPTPCAPLIEGCVDSYASALAACRGGADRLELCGQLVIGGVTPSPAMLEQVLRDCPVPVNVLIRHRVGDFLYTDAEMDQYLDRSVQDGLLLLDEARRADLIEAIIGYQKVQQYRNQINHASDTVGLLPLTVRDVRATLEEICTALDAITDLKPNSNGVHRLSLTERLSYVPAQ